MAATPGGLLDQVEQEVPQGERLPAGSLVLEDVSQGWPAILANLKTLLETGDTLPAEFR